MHFYPFPLYNYLHAIFAPTERERKRNLIRGIESSLRAIENLPYTSSMMGDISIVHPYLAVAPEPYPPATKGAENYSSAKSANWKKPDGSTWWPDNNGFADTPSKTTLQPGTRIDRYGNNLGKFAAPEGTPFGQRSLPPGAENSAYNTYEVVKPFDVHSGTTAPWFDQPGGGIQYQLPMSIKDLRNLGYVRIINNQRLKEKIKMNKLVNTKTLEEYILSMYDKIIPLMQQDGISIPLNTLFRKNTPHDNQGEFCFTDEDGYHYRVLERGKLYCDDITQNIIEITYWTIDSEISEAAAIYESKHRLPNQDFRRIMFAKTLQYYNILGDEYIQMAQSEIAGILNLAPFQD